MSERALAFVEEWVSDHVRAEDKSGDEPARAKALADRCRADAGAHGIPASEIADAIDDLTEFMTGAIEEAAERKAHAEETEDVKPVPDLVDVEGVENAEQDALEDEEDEHALTLRQQAQPGCSAAKSGVVVAAWIAGSFDTNTALRAFCPAMTKHLLLPACGEKVGMRGRCR